jgi:tetratricopeptide (TPR) repeat protein
MVAVGSAGAQPVQSTHPGPADPVIAGDSLYRLRRPAEALALYRSALAADPRRHDALCKASQAEVDLAVASPKEPGADSLLAAARAHAEAATQVRPRDPEGHFAVGRALGRKALSVGPRDRVRYATRILAAAQEALGIDSTHPGALHVMGMWHAEVMRVNGLSRAFARAFLGGQVFGRASWEDAQRYLEASVQHDPGRIVHHLDLAGVLADRGDAAGARRQYEWIARAPLTDPNDDLYKRQAADRVKKL